MERQVAVLIDGDNVSPKYAEYIKQEAMSIGRIKICRLYGSISSPTVKSWYHEMPAQGIVPVLQISYANGKSIADQALTIDAMDILYTGDVDVICLVTSDSDFTKLAYRIKEFGKIVIGMGEQKTNESLAKACDQFKLLDLIYSPDQAVDLKDHSEELETRTALIEHEQPSVKELAADLEDDLNEETHAKESSISIPTEDIIIADILGSIEDDWENLANIGINISKRRPGFDVRIFGYKNMSDFVRKHSDFFELQKTKAEDGIHSVVYIRKRAGVGDR